MKVDAKIVAMISNLNDIAIADIFDMLDKRALILDLYHDGTITGDDIIEADENSHEIDEDARQS